MAPVERRGEKDRRRRPRGGRRASERRATWQRFRWLAAAYAVYLAVRAVRYFVRGSWRSGSS